MRQPHKTSHVLRLSYLILLMLWGNHQIGRAQHTLNGETAFLIKLNLDTAVVEDHCEEFIYRFKKESYKLIKDDEFEMREARNELLEKVSNISLDQIYTIKHQTSFADYDFERSGFAFVPVTVANNFSILDLAFGTKLNTNGSIDLRFLNGEELTFFPLAEDEADMLLKERKNYKNGKIDRTIHMNIQYVIDGIEKTINITNKPAYTLTARILQVDFYDATESSNQTISSIETYFKQEFDEKNKLSEENTALREKLNELENKTISTDQQFIQEISAIIKSESLSDETKTTLIKSIIQRYEASATASN